MKKKILFGITSLTLGGAERVLVDLVNELVKDYDITVFTIYDGGPLKKELNNKIKTISMYNKPYNEYSKFAKIKISLNLLFKAKAPEGYDVRVAFLEGPITRLFAKKSKSKKISWVHIDMTKFLTNSFKDRLKKHFDKKIYNKYDKIVFVSEDSKQKFNSIFGKNYDEIVIRNFINYNKVVEKSKEKVSLPYNKNDINLVSVCRLVDQKAVDRFINVHARLEKDGIHSKVYIVGDGPNRYSLQKQIDKLGETENFYLLGPKENPYPFIKNADYFCLLSYYEGYGMVVEEAKILNKTVVVTDLKAIEAIKDYEKAIVLKNTEEGIYLGLKKLLASDNIKHELEQDETTINTKSYDEILERVKSIL